MNIHFKLLFPNAPTNRATIEFTGKISLQSVLYELKSKYIGGNEELLVGDRLALGSAQYNAEPLFKPDVTELYFTIEYLSRISQATWRIPIGK